MSYFHRDGHYDKHILTFTLSFPIVFPNLVLFTYLVLILESSMFCPVIFTVFVVLFSNLDLTWSSLLAMVVFGANGVLLVNYSCPTLT